MKTFCFCVLMASLIAVPEIHADPRTGPRRYKPIIQVTEEVDINDITFTTSAPGMDFPHKPSSYYAGAKPEAGAVGKGGYNRPQLTYHVGSSEKIYTTGQPLIVPVPKYKPYKVFKVQDGFRPVPYGPKLQDKSKLLTFDPPTTYAGPDAPKQSSKVVAFSKGRQLPAKAPTKPSTFLTQDNKNFVPSPTFSPTVLALMSNENSQKHSESSDVSSFVTPKVVDWPKPTKKPPHVKTVKKIPEISHSSGVKGDDSDESSGPYASHREAPEQSESFLSEISTIHNKGGNNANNLDGVADSLDLKTGERVEFQMYGMDGPQSYKFGFDTGKGHNRHFRFEERDNTGKVKGHYGYLDEDGKMRIMKYEADPITGFHAGPVEISPDEN